MYPTNSTSASEDISVSTSSVDEAPVMPRKSDIVSMDEIPPDGHASSPSSQRLSLKQRKVPAPIKIYSNYSDFDEPRTSIYSPALSLSSTPKSGNARYQSSTPQRPAPTPPMNRLQSILVLSAPNSARRLPTPTERGSRPPQKVLYPQITNSKEPKNVRFAVVQSPACSNLKSPAYFDNFRRSLSPMPYSPKTPDAFLFEDPDITPESPIEDAPMLSITPIEDALQEGERKEQGSSPQTSRGRQFDRETFLCLTGRELSPAVCLPPNINDQEALIIASDEVSDSTEPPYLDPVCQGHAGQEKDIVKIRSSAPASHSKGYLPQNLQTDRQSILSSYFSQGSQPVSN